MKNWIARRQTFGDYHNLMCELERFHWPPTRCNPFLSGTWTSINAYSTIDCPERDALLRMLSGYYSEPVSMSTDGFATGGQHCPEGCFGMHLPA